MNITDGIRKGLSSSTFLKNIEGNFVEINLNLSSILKPNKICIII